MSYSEKDGVITITLHREDFDRLLYALGLAIGVTQRNDEDPTSLLELTNRINEGNPDFVPYRTEALNC